MNVSDLLVVDGDLMSNLRSSATVESFGSTFPPFCPLDCQFYVAEGYGKEDPSSSWDGKWGP